MLQTAPAVSAQSTTLEASSSAPAPRSHLRLLQPTDTVESELLRRLRANDEAAFAELFSRHDPTLQRLARSLLPTTALAEEVVQETWLAVLRGIHRFEGRASLKTWIFRILVNRSITRRSREQRAIPFSALGDERAVSHGRASSPDSFPGEGRGRQPMFSTSNATPEQQLDRHEIMRAIRESLEELPERQQLVVTLRDLEGWSAHRICALLDISEANQRVLLHRGRVKLREALTQRLDLDARDSSNRVS